MAAPIAALRRRTGTVLVERIRNTWGRRIKLAVLLAR
jgi:hypothetical protein